VKILGIYIICVVLFVFVWDRLVGGKDDDQ
jgi:hypothetical protein